MTLPSSYFFTSSATASSRSSRVTTMISSTSSFSSKARTLRTSTGRPPSAAKILSLPMRCELPAATITAVQKGRSPFFRLGIRDFQDSSVFASNAILPSRKLPDAQPLSCRMR